MQHTVEMRGDRTFLCVSEDGAHPLDRALMATAARIASPALVPFVMERDGAGTLRAIWDVTGLEPLNARAARGFNGREACALIERLGMLIDVLVAACLPIKNVMLDASCIYMDADVAGAPRFVFLPFAGIAPDLSAASGFFERIPQLVQPLDGQASDAMRSYASFFSSGAPFDIVRFATHTKQTAAAIGCMPVSEVGLATDRAGRPDDSLTTVLADEQAAPDDTGTTLLDADEGCPDDSGTTLLVEDEGLADDSGTTVLVEDHAPEPTVPPMQAPQGTTVLDMIDIDALMGGSKGAPDGTSEKPAGVGVHFSGASSPMPEPPVRRDLVNAAAEPPAEAPAAPATPAVPEPVAELDTEPAERPSGDASPASSDASACVAAPAPQTSFYLTRLGTGERVQLLGRRFVVGKSKHSTFQVKNTTTVSRSHAIFCVDRGACTVCDDDSRNGTFINGERVAPGVACPLEDGDTVRLSDVDFVFEAIAAER